MYNVVAELLLRGPSNLGQVVGQVNSALRGINGDIDLRFNSGGLQQVNAQLQAARANMQSLRSVSSSAAAGVGSVGSSAASAASGVNRYAASANSAAASARQLGRGAAEAAPFVEQLGALAGLSARRFAAFALAAGSISTLAAGLRAGLTEALEFERGLVKIQQISTETAGEIGGIADEVRRVSTQFGVSSLEMLKVAEQLKQTGLSAQDVKKALEPLAQAQLSPSFGDIAKLTQGAVTAMRQFGLQTKDLGNILGGVNAVASNFAVESGDLIEAVKKAGGQFKATGGDLNEFLGVFTAVRSTTRESAEEIATGLRTVFSRIQNPQVVQALKEVGINLRYVREEAESLGESGLENQFVGPYEAVKRLSEGLASLRSTDPRFSQIAQLLGGYEQISRVIPLVRQFGEAQRALNVAATGGVSLQLSAEKAQDATLVRLTKLREEYTQLFQKLVGSDGFKAAAGGAIELASAVAKILEVTRPLIPVLTTLATVRLFQGVGGFAARAAGTFTGSSLARPVTSLPTRGYSQGGPVDGHGTGDTVRARLTPGEFVVTKEAAGRVGMDKLRRLNSGVQHFAEGGEVKRPSLLDRFKAKGRGDVVARAQAARAPRPTPVEPAAPVDPALEKAVELQLRAQADKYESVGETSGVVGGIGNLTAEQRARLAANQKYYVDQGTGDFSGPVLKTRNYFRAKFPTLGGDFDDVFSASLVRAGASFDASKIGDTKKPQNAFAGFLYGAFRNQNQALFRARQARRETVSLNAPRGGADDEGRVSSLADAVAGREAEPSEQAARRGGEYAAEEARREKQDAAYKRALEIKDQLGAAGTNATPNRIVTQLLKEEGVAPSNSLAKNVALLQGGVAPAPEIATERAARATGAARESSGDIRSLVSAIRDLVREIRGGGVGGNGRGGRRPGRPDGGFFTNQSEPTFNVTGEVADPEAAAYQRRVLSGNTLEDALGGRYRRSTPFGARGQYDSSGRFVNPGSGPGVDTLINQRAAGISFPAQYADVLADRQEGRERAAGEERDAVARGARTESTIFQRRVRDSGLGKAGTFDPLAARAYYLQKVQGGGDATEVEGALRDAQGQLGAGSSSYSSLYRVAQTRYEQVVRTAQERRGEFNGAPGVLPGELSPRGYRNDVARTRVDARNAAELDRAASEQAAIGRRADGEAEARAREGADAEVRRHYREPEYYRDLTPLASEYRRLQSAQAGLPQTGGSSVGFGGLVSERAVNPTYDRLVRSGPAVSQKTRSEAEATELTRAETSLRRELYSAQQRLLKALFPDIAAVEAHRLAEEAVARALRGEEEVVVGRSGRVFGLQSTVAAATAQGQAAPGAGGAEYNLGRVSGFFGRVGSYLTDPTRAPRSLQNLNKFFSDRLGTGVATASLIALPYLSQGASSLGGSSQEAVASGRTVRYKAAQATSGLLESAATGGVVGSIVGGFTPLTPAGGAIAGAAAGALIGFVTSLREAEKEIRDVRIGNSLQGFADKLDSISNLGNDSAPIVVSAARSNLAAYRSEVERKNVDAATHFFGGFDINEFAGVQQRSLRSDLGPQLPQFVQALNRSAEQTARNSPGASADETLRLVRDGNQGVNQEFIRIVAGIRQIPVSEVEAELRKTVDAARRSQAVERVSARAREGEDRNINAFGRLVLSLEAANDGLSRLRASAQVLSDSFEGVVNAGTLDTHAEALGQFGRQDKGSLRALDIVAAAGGETGQRLLDTGGTADEVARVLPSVLSVVASRGLGGPEAAQDFATQVSAALRDALPKNNQSEAAIATISRGLFEASRERGVEQLHSAVTTDVSAFSGRLLAPLGDPVRDNGGRALRLIGENAQNYVGGLATYRERYNAVGQGQDRLAELELAGRRAGAEVQASRGGFRSQALDLLPLSVLTSADRSRQERLAGEAGPGAYDPANLGRRLRDTNQQLIGAGERRQRAFERTGGRGDEFKDAAVEFVNLQDRAANLQQALKSLADVSQRNAAVQEKLAKIGEERGSRLSFGERYLSSDADGRAQIDRGLILSREAQRRGNLDGFVSGDQRLVIETLRSLGGAKLSGLPGQPNAQDLLENLIRGSSGGAFGPDANSAKDEAALQKELLGNFKKAQDAQAELVGTQEKLNEQFLTNLEKMQAAFFANLTRMLGQDRLTDLVNKGGVVARDLGGLRTLDRQRDTLTALGFTRDDQLGNARAAVPDIEGYAAARGRVKDIDAAKGRFDPQAAFDAVFNRDVDIGNGTTRRAREIYEVNPLLGKSAFDVTDIRQLLFKQLTEGQQLPDGTARRIIENAQKNLENDPTVGRHQRIGEVEAQTVAHLRDAAGRELGVDQARLLREDVDPAAGKLRNRGINVGALDDQLDRNGGAKGVVSAINAFDGVNNSLGGLKERLDAAATSLTNLNDAILKAGGRPVEVERHASGGVAGTHPGSPSGTDNIPAWLSKGEFVVNARSSQKHMGLLKAINSGHYAEGGVAEPILVNAIPPQVAGFRGALSDAALAVGRDVGDEADIRVFVHEQEARFARQEGDDSGRVLDKELRRQAYLDPFGQSGILAARGRLEGRRGFGGDRTEAAIAATRFAGRMGNLAQQQNLLRRGRSFFGRGRADVGAQSSLLAGAVRYRQERDDLAGAHDFPQGEYLAKRATSRVPLPVRGFATGGSVTDTIPAVLADGEYVLNRSAVRRVGVNALDRVNHFADGGLVGSNPGAGAGLSPEVAQAVQKLGETVGVFGNAVTGLGKLSTAFDGFLVSADKLAKALEGFPATLNVQGSQRVEVVINGATALERLTPALKEMVEDTMTTKLNEVFKRHFPDAGVDLQ